VERSPSTDADVPSHLRPLYGTWPLHLISRLTNHVFLRRLIIEHLGMYLGQMCMDSYMCNKTA